MGDHASLLDQFDREVVATYRGNTYRVRDNGAVYRLRRPQLRKRPLDEIWTFGTPNDSTGYMHSVLGGAKISTVSEGRGPNRFGAVR